MKIDRTPERIRFNLPSSLGVVGEAIKTLRDWLKSVDSGDESPVVLIFRELVNNAVEHGNKKVDGLEVEVEVAAAGEGRFRITVRDEGSGFDHEALDLRLTDDPTQIRNRGLALVNSFADELVFNDEGNEVTVWVSMPHDIGFELSQDDTWKTIQPSSNITAEVADTFRNLLLDLVNSGYQRYRFDLSRVEDIDSIGLSLFVVFANMVQNRVEGAQLEVVGANKDIANLFEMTRLSRIYKLA